MKKIVFIAVMLIFCFAPPLQAASQEEIIQNPEKYPELREYRQIFFDNLRDQKMDWPEKCQKMINEYEKFIEKYPQGEFTDEAKLRIAEFYELSFRKEKALPYLKDIIENHPKADYFSLSQTSQPRAKTAAWALYYRGLWFLRIQSIDDWERVLKDYPESGEPASLAKAALAKYRSRLRP